MTDEPNSESLPVATFPDVALADSKTSDTKFTERPSSGGDPHALSSGETPSLRHPEKPFKFITTWRFWVILVLGQILSWCIVSTNTLTEYLSLAGANIPAFQSLFNYALLSVVYTSWTLYKYGFKKWFELIWKDGWKYFVLAFADVQGVHASFVLANE